MTARDAVRRTGRGLALTAAGAAVGWAAATGLTVLTVSGLLDVAFGLPRGLREILRLIAAGGAALAAGIVLWRARGVLHAEQVALWIEERRPELRYALVTAVDSRYAGRVPALESAVGTAWRGVLRPTVLRALLVPAAVAALGAALLALVPAGAVSRVTAPRPGDALDAVRSPDAGLGPLVVTVTAPGYAGGREVVLENPVAVEGIVGSRVRVAGFGTGDSAPGVSIDGTALPTRTGPRRWEAGFRMPERAATVRVRGRGEERLLVLEPVPDSVPAVRLTTPARDTVLRTATGELLFSAELADDFGLARGAFEVIVSSGQGESFVFRTARFGVQSFAGRTGSLQAVLRLDTMRLGPGDLLHLRAVGTDRNDVTGPGTGVSETRTVRIARADEYDSVAVITLPPLPADSALLSQRMLIVLTEALVERVPRLARDTVVAESRSLARDQTRLRRRVADILFMRLGGDADGEHAHGAEEEDGEAGGADLTPEALLRAAEASVAEGAGEALDFHADETPVLALNRPLLEAYNAMWEAGSALAIGEPAAALPHMYAALEAIQRARAAERIYLRGRPPRVVVDLARVRLAGRIADAAPGGRTAAPADRRTVLARRLEAVLSGVGTTAALADSLLVLRVAALEEGDGLAAAMGEAAALLRAGGDATETLVRVRRLLGPPIRRTAGLPGWTEGWTP